jgi:hypothetical protein
MKNLTLLFAGLLFSGMAHAEGFMPWTDVTAMADADKDGMLTMPEVEQFKEAADYPGFQPFMTDHFKDLDTNSDGMVDAAELGKAKEMFQMDDTQMSQAFFKKQGFMPKGEQ